MDRASQRVGSVVVLVRRRPEPWSQDMGSCRFRGDRGLGLADLVIICTSQQLAPQQDDDDWSNRSMDAVSRGPRWETIEAEDGGGVQEGDAARCRLRGADQDWPLNTNYPRTCWRIGGRVRCNRKWPRWSRL